MSKYKGGTGTAKLKIKIVAAIQVVSRDMWGLVMVSVGHGNNDSRLRVGERVEWMYCHSIHKHLHQLLPTIHQFSESERLRICVSQGYYLSQYFGEAGSY